VQRLERPPVLKSLIQDKLKRFITEQRLAPGDLLPPEGRLADDLGVSRGSVREAVKSLESLGVVEVRHGDGVRVREFNFDSTLGFLSWGLEFQPAKAAEILQIRKWLEGAAIAEAAERLSAADIAAIEDVLDDWQAKIGAGQSTALEDRRFHRLLYAPLGNGSLLSLIDIFWVVYNRLPARTVGHDADPAATLQAHRDLLNALKRRDPTLARKRMEGHFRNVETRIGRAVSSARGAGRPSAPSARARGGK
jgi:DNA-binding FadR family transcriptional regulator